MDKRNKKFVKQVEKYERDREIIEMIRDGHTLTSISKKMGITKQRVGQLKKEYSKRSLAQLQFSAFEMVNSEVADLDVMIEELKEKIEKVESTLDENGNEVGVANPAFYAQILRAMELKAKLLNLSELFTDEIMRTRNQNSNITFMFSQDTAKSQDGEDDVDGNGKKKTVTMQIADDVKRKLHSEGLMTKEGLERGFDQLNKIRSERLDKPE